MYWFEVFALFMMPLAALAIGHGIYYFMASDKNHRHRNE